MPLQGCTRQSAGDFEKAQSMLAGLETYTATAEIIVRGNKLIGTYKIRQYFKYPDKYRLEVIEPTDKTGKVTLYDGERIWIHHPQINQTFTMEGYKEVEESSMFPGYFARKLLTGETASYDLKRIGPEEYVVIKVDIPGGNNYRKTQVLYIDKSSMLPARMEILNSDGEAAVTVYYRDFIPNPRLDDNLFRNVVNGIASP
jgi:outer membrane lipoprotein-sorting protein